MCTVTRLVTLCMDDAALVGGFCQIMRGVFNVAFYQVICTETKRAVVFFLASLPIGASS